MSAKRIVVVSKNTQNVSLDVDQTRKSLFDEESLQGGLSSLSISIQSWLKKRGRAVKTAIPELHKIAIKECFDMIDTNGSNALDVKEVYDLFQVRWIVP